MAFRFSLQQVLDYRAQLEDQAKVQLGKVQAQYLETERRLEELEKMALEQEKALYDGALDLMDRWLREHYLRGLREDIARTSRMLQQLAILVEQARSDLIDKAKDRKVLEKFKEKQAERHAREERNQEQRDYDETASIRYKAATF